MSNEAKKKKIEENQEQLAIPTTRSMKIHA